MLHYMLKKRFKTLPNWVNHRINQASSTQLKVYMDNFLKHDSLEQIFDSNS